MEDRELVHQGQTVKAKVCYKVLRCVRENIRHRWPDLWSSGVWRLCCTLLLAIVCPLHVIIYFLFGCNHTVVAVHLFNSPDLTSYLFFLFLEIKFKLKGCHFEMVWEIQRWCCTCWQSRTSRGDAMLYRCTRRLLWQGFKSDAFFFCLFCQSQNILINLDLSFIFWKFSSKLAGGFERGITNRFIC